jgi:hypothetical protein
MKTTAQQIIYDLRIRNYSIEEIKNSLCDGEFLALEGYTDDDQELIKKAYAIVQNEKTTEKTIYQIIEKTIYQ